jgi:hypothetical protein
MFQGSNPSATGKATVGYCRRYRFRAREREEWRQKCLRVSEEDRSHRVLISRYAQ